nr:hypothetical protein [Gemmatimonadota bacterium]
TVTTRDAWSTTPSARVQSQTASVGVDERNVMGTGREAAAFVTSNRGQVGVGVAVRDPFLAVGGGELSLAAGLSAYRDGRDAAVTLENRRRSAFDPRHIEGTLRRSTRGEFDATADIVRRDRAAFLGGWAVHPSARGVTSLLAGVEGERTTLIAAEGAAIVGPARVDRDFAGLDVGVRREAASYDTVTWLMPAHALVDVPLGFETEAIVGGGHDFERGQPALHVDLWGGRVWNPDRRHLIVADLWTSGYWGDDRLDAASVRGELSLFRAARRGLWIAHLAGERLINPDPDVRALASSDPTLAALPHDSRLARGAIAGSLERDIRIRALSRSWALDGALFGAASTRWAPAVPLNDELYVGVLGAGLRVAPLRPARGTFRIDAGYPVTRSRELRRAPFLAISVTPWLGADRVRDGRKGR